MIASAIVGRSSGKVIRQNVYQPDAPSTSAASNTSPGSMTSPASTMIATNGVVFQMSAIISPMMAEVGVPRMTG